MRSFRHWTPRYLTNRVAWMIYERRNPDKPWLTPTANALLSTLLLPTDRGLEWGSGRSTVWFAKRLSHLTSVEDDRDWHARVRDDLVRQGVANVDYRFESLDPATDPSSSPYVRVAERFDDGSLGFVLVDGKLREYCAIAALRALAPGGVLVVDNCNWYLDRPSHSPASRTGLGPLNSLWGEFERRVEGWRGIWTSQGVTDTALWIKPPA